MFEECPHCHTRVFPKPDRLCPSCRKNIDRAMDGDDGLCPVSLSEQTVLPARCLQCNEPTDRMFTVREKYDLDAWAPADPGMFEGFGVQFYRTEMSPNVSVQIPFCTACHSLADPKVLWIDYETNQFVFAGHPEFREALLKLNQAVPAPESGKPAKRAPRSVQKPPARRAPATPPGARRKAAKK